MVVRSVMVVGPVTSDRTFEDQRTVRVGGGVCGRTPGTLYDDGRTESRERDQRRRSLQDDGRERSDGEKKQVKSRGYSGGV